MLRSTIGGVVCTGGGVDWGMDGVDILGGVEGDGDDDEEPDEFDDEDAEAGVEDGDAEDDAE